jgi:putative endonuclease
LARWAHIRQLADIGSNPFSATQLRKVERSFPFFIWLVGLISASRNTLGANLFTGFLNLYFITFMYTVYVLKSIRFDKIYIGFTSDLNARLIAHNHPANKGWTHKFQPWEIKYSETFANKTEAMKREKQLKSAKGREFIKNLIF